MANNVRHILGQKLDMSLDMFLNNHPHISLNMVIPIFNALWKDLGFEVARNKNNNGNMEQCSRESLILWNSLPISIQSELQLFVAAQKKEELQETHLMSNLDNIYEQIFVPSKEQHVIRPLCVMLGYLSTSTIDFLSLNAMEHNFIEYEKKRQRS